MSADMPPHGWRIKGDIKFPERRKPGIRIRLRWLWKFVPVVIRYALWFVYMKLRRRPIFINNFSMVKAKPIYGVPIGGIGSGSIGRSFLGDFCRRQISPASMYEYGPTFCDNFILSIGSHSEPVSAETQVRLIQPVKRRVTTIGGMRESSCCKTKLKSWKCEVSPSDVEYVGQFPRSWTRYTLKEMDVVVTCRQVSPVMPHDYRDSCLPVGVFIWTVEYTGDKERVGGSLTFTWTGDSGLSSQDTFEVKTADGVIHGLSFKTPDKTKTSYAIGVRRTGEVSKSAVSFLKGFDENGDGKSVWDSLVNDGVLPCPWDEEGKSGSGNGGAICLSFSVGKSNPTQTLEMAVSWDNPEVKFPYSSKTHTRRYARWFHGPEEVVSHALDKYASWEEKIDMWQAPVLNDPLLPDWYKSALFNELYYLVDGGGVWIEADEDMRKSLSDFDPRKEFGRFLYLESHEYIMYNTIDVHFYAAAAFGDLWPEVELSIQLDVATATLAEDDSIVWSHSAGRIPRKVKDCVPHDVGCPGEDPWEKLNAYQSHDTSNWKDLNLKFVLESYRDYLTCFRDHEGADGEGASARRSWFLNQVWPVCLTVMQKAEKAWDQDGDGMIENDPDHPDQTYDMWTMDGPSAYCGILWVCSLYCTWKMANIVGDEQAKETYEALMKRAVGVLDQKLWNGSYYRFDCSRGDRREVIMADQLCGLWSLLLGAAKNEDIDEVEAVLNPVFSKDRITSTLTAIVENNVRKSMGGKMGAVNGYSPLEERIDTSAAQAEETWTGVSYALAATMFYYGMEKEGFETAEGIYRTVYERSGLGYQTPEALTDNVYYRAPGYMRPLCIWSMHLALDMKRRAVNRDQL